MRNKVGIWIDHKKALIVKITDKGEEIGLIISKVEKQPGRSNGKRSIAPYASLMVPGDDRREKKFTGHLKIYYDAIIASIRDSESILIFGPGEAKTELKKYLEKEKLGKRIVGFETIDKMTDRQISAKVRSYFEIKKRQLGV